MSDRKLVLANFASPLEAEIARTQLEDVEIWCSIADAGIVATDPLLGVAVGGIRLIVFEDDLERAAEVLAAERDGFLEDSAFVDSQGFADDSEPDSELVGTTLQCPKCGSAEVGFAPVVHAYWGLLVVAAVAPFILPPDADWDWIRAAQYPVVATMFFLGFWLTVLKLLPLGCRDCKHSGGRKAFSRDHY